MQPVVRLDALIAEEAALHAGLGLAVAAARAVRVEVTGAIGRGESPTGGSRTEGRVDGVVRFTLGPGATRRWAPYGGAGAGVRIAEGATRELLLLVVGAEGPPLGRALPFVELGLGGGVRIGAGLRRGAPPER